MAEQWQIDCAVTDEPQMDAIAELHRNDRRWRFLLSRVVSWDGDLQLSFNLGITHPMAENWQAVIAAAVDAAIAREADGKA